MNSIEDCLNNNATYAEAFSFGSLPTPPRKRLAIVTCMDARLETGSALGLNEGDAHIIRNAGGVVTDDVIRSLIISQRLLQTREIMVLHHSGCGMLTFTDQSLKDSLEEETGIRPSFSIETFSNLEDDVRQSIARIQSSPFIPHKENIRGFIYKVETGRIHEVK
jgi:carbonic anhydrase